MRREEFLPESLTVYGSLQVEAAKWVSYLGLIPKDTMFALSRNPVFGLSIEADFPINSAKKPLETGFLDRNFKKCKDSAKEFQGRNHPELWLRLLIALAVQKAWLYNHPP